MPKNLLDPRSRRHRSRRKQFLEVSFRSRTGAYPRMIRAYLIRHGESTANRNGLYAGQTNVPLTEEGRRQAYALARRFAGVRLDLIVASDQQRSLETARILAEHHAAQVKVDPRFRECHFGLWEGLSYDAVVSRWRDAFGQWCNGGDEAAPPGGESWRDLYQRTVTAWEEHLQQLRTGAIALITHKGPILAILSRVLEIDRRRVLRLHVASASVTIVDYYDEGPVVLSLNDTGHLG